jgi:hypothetical protein
MTIEQIIIARPYRDFISMNFPCNLHKNKEKYAKKSPNVKNLLKFVCILRKNGLNLKKIDNVFKEGETSAFRWLAKCNF